ncbi:MAG: hypothetical protein K8S99_03710 [Planctomycetes bacterium]|nr:hypothetical protein [Planctomycetota bacterium]
MAHRLFPIADGAYLEPKEIVRRLKAEFQFVEADASAGTEVVADMIKQFEKMKAPQAIIDVNRKMLGKAIRVVVSDRSNFINDYICFTAMPGGAPFIGYSSKQHEEAAAPLVERVCMILHYKSVLV